MMVSVKIEAQHLVMSMVPEFRQSWMKILCRRSIENNPYCRLARKTKAVAVALQTHCSHFLVDTA